MTFKHFSNTDLILLVANIKIIDGSGKGDFIKTEASKELLERIEFSDEEYKEYCEEHYGNRKFPNINTTKDI